MMKSVLPIQTEIPKNCVSELKAQTNADGKERKGAPSGPHTQEESHEGSKHLLQLAAKDEVKSKPNLFFKSERHPWGNSVLG